MFKKIFLICLILSPGIFATWNPPYYKQTDPRWANEELGTGPWTIGEAGCAMTSCTMMVAGEGVLINGEIPNPGTFNQWLIHNGGFWGKTYLVWTSLDQLGFTFEGFEYNHLQIIQAFQQGKRVVLNVLDGGHFVLGTGVNELGYIVHDPDFNRTTYLFQDIVLASIYTFGSNNNNTTDSTILNY